MTCLLQKRKREKREWKKKRDAVAKHGGIVVRERVFLFSRNTGDSTVGSPRDKKENCSTRKGLRLGTRFREFPQTPRGRGFSLLEFYSLF